MDSTPDAITIACGTSLGCLLDIQKRDGGWAYTTNSSWTEPTCYAIMALRSAGGPEPAIVRGCDWLARRQRRDGGWSPGPGVEKSTHVTSLAILALSDMPEHEMKGYGHIADRGVEWLLAQSGAESSLWARFGRVVMRTGSAATEHAGWPWIPGAAAWVIPTSLAICALSRQKRGAVGRGISASISAKIAARINEGRQFLLSRRCPDHGWNHGGLFRSGETPESYPETTGIALLAMAGARQPDFELSLRRGEQHAGDPKSSEGAYWLRLGLLAAGRKLARSPVNYRDWTVNQVALRIITEAAELGHNPFISPFSSPFFSHV